MTKLSRRRFLKTAAGAAAGAGVLGAVTALGDPPGPSYALQGIDVSHYQGTVTWADVRASGRRFAFCKATEGLTYTDPTFTTNWAGMRAAGLLRGAYHFGHPGDDAVSQADRFCDTIRP